MTEPADDASFPGRQASRVDELDRPDQRDRKRQELVVRHSRLIGGSLRITE